MALTGVVDQLIRELLSSTDEPPPFEADARALWAVRRAWAVALGPGGTSEVLAAMPDVSDPKERADFLRGLVDGVGKSVSAYVKEQVEGVAAAVKGLLAFYGFVYDAEMWVQMLKVWVAAPGTSVETFERYLATDYPEVYAAVRDYERFVAELDAFADRLRDTSKPAGETWRVCEQLITRWLGMAPEWFGGQLRPHVDAFVAAAGDARDQGVVVGRVGGRVIIEVVLMAVSVDDLARSARGVERLAGQRRASLTSRERTKVVREVEEVSPGIVTAASGVAHAERVAARLYDEVAKAVEPYTTLSRKTQAYNRYVKDLHGLTASSAEYVSLRLDAHHIVKASLFKDFAADFRRVFGWRKAGDMDCIALPHLLHGRSGEKLRSELGLHGAENLKSLSYDLDSFIARRQRDRGKFANLEDVFTAHEDFYREFSSQMDEQLKPWFTASLAKIRGKG